MINTMDDKAGLTERWESRWPSCRPIGHELRTSAATRWVRLHSLPGSKRYAETPEERAEVLSRHNIVLSDLFRLVEVADEPPVALTITCAWGDRDDRERKPDLVAADPAASYWRSFHGDSEPDHSAVSTHLWTSTRPWAPGSMDELFMLVADGKTADVVIAPLFLAWLYRPYDGGADVMAASTVERDRLAAKYEPWLSPHPHGL